MGDHTGLAAHQTHPARRMYPSRTKTYFDWQAIAGAGGEAAVAVVAGSCADRGLTARCEALVANVLQLFGWDRVVPWVSLAVRLAAQRRRCCIHCELSNKAIKCVLLWHCGCSVAALCAHSKKHHTN